MAEGDKRLAHDMLRHASNKDKGHSGCCMPDTGGLNGAGNAWRGAVEDMRYASLSSAAVQTGKQPLTGSPSLASNPWRRGGQGQPQHTVRFGGQPEKRLQKSETLGGHMSQAGSFPQCKIATVCSAAHTRTSALCAGAVAHVQGGNVWRRASSSLYVHGLAFISTAASSGSI